jgi:hypothetical protein
MHTAEQIRELRAKMIEHLERARALANQTGDFAAGYFIETARDRLTAQPVAALSVRLAGRRQHVAGRQS